MAEHAVGAAVEDEVMPCRGLLKPRASRKRPGELRRDGPHRADDVGADREKRREKDRDDKRDQNARSTPGSTQPWGAGLSVNTPPF